MSTESTEETLPLKKRWKRWKKRQKRQLAFKWQCLRNSITNTGECVSLVCSVMKGQKPSKSLAQQSLRRVVMLVISELTIDPRVYREARTLADAGYHVTVLCPAWFSEPEARPSLDWGENIEIQLTPFGYHFSYFPFVFDPQFFAALCQLRAEVIHCHDLNTCLMGLAAARRIGAALVCDFHEWFSENVIWSSRKNKLVPVSGLRRWWYRFQEKLMLREANVVITVCDAIAGELERLEKPVHPVQVIRNIPDVSQYNNETAQQHLKSKLGLPSDSFIVLYQGGVGPTRYLEPIVEAMALTPERYHLVLRGPGMPDYRAHYHALAEQRGVLDRVHCLDPVSPKEILEEAASADVGVWSLEALCFNFKHALPNKIFEYLSAGLPVLVADYPEAGKLVKEHAVGLCFNPDSPASIAGKMIELGEHPERQRMFRTNIPIALSRFDAKTEWQQLVQIYTKLLS